MEAVIFDMDGLLLDTEKIAFRVFKDMIGNYDLELDVETFSKFVGLTKASFVYAIKLELDAIEKPEKFVNQFYKQIENKLFETVPDVKEGALELITHLKSKKVPIAVATSTYEELATTLLSKTKLLKHFDVVVTGDMVSKSKPSPDIYFKTFEQLNVDYQHTFILEDSANGIRAAHASGAKAILIPDLKIPSDEVKNLAFQAYPSLVCFLKNLKKCRKETN